MTMPQDIPATELKSHKFDWHRCRAAVTLEAGKFPVRFRLRATQYIPECWFTIHEPDSYVNDEGVVMLYVHRLWLNPDGTIKRQAAFAKGTTDELMREVVRG